METAALDPRYVRGEVCRQAISHFSQLAFVRYSSFIFPTNYQTHRNILFGKKADKGINQSACPRLCKMSSLHVECCITHMYVLMCPYNYKTQELKVSVKREQLLSKSKEDSLDYKLSHNTAK